MAHYYGFSIKCVKGCLPWRVNCVTLSVGAFNAVKKGIPFLDCQPTHVSPRGSSVQLLQDLLTGLPWPDYAIV